MFKYEIFPEDNLIVVIIFDNYDHDILQIFRAADKALIIDPDYREYMNAIIDYRRAILPKNQIFYNNMSKKISFKVRFEKLIRLFSEDGKEFEKNFKIFNIFYKGDKYKNKTASSYSVADALTMANISNQNSRAASLLNSY